MGLLLFLNLSSYVFKELYPREALHINSDMMENIQTKQANPQNGDKWL